MAAKLDPHYQSQFSSSRRLCAHGRRAYQPQSCPVRSQQEYKFLLAELRQNLKVE